jgi:anti-sigma factor RsiW
MTAEGCRAWRERIGALVLGQLDAEEGAATEAHLEGCAECRAEAEALAPVAALLSHADADQVAQVPAAPPHLGDRIAALIASERRAVRRRRIRLGFGIATATAATTAAALVAVALLGSSDEGAPPETVAFRSLPPGLSADASLAPQPWGTELTMSVQGFRPGTLCQVWLRRADGTRVPAGSFRYVYAGESDEANLSSAVSPDDATAIGLRAGSRTFVEPLPPA